MYSKCYRERKREKKGGGEERERERERENERAMAMVGGSCMHGALLGPCCMLILDSQLW